jgi:ubiquinone/menaquinone biosynthesis C-methylase UbiE
MKKDKKFYAMLRTSSNLQHSSEYAQFYRDEDERSQNNISHSGKCEIVQKLSDSFRDPPVVLDLGCGTGRYFHCLTKLRFLVGVDPSANMLRMAKNPVNHKTAPIQLVQGSLHEIEFKPDSFDLIMCIGVFGGVSPLDEYSLQQIARFLKPSGILFFTVPEYLPTRRTWKGRLAEFVEPFLWGDAKRYVRLRLRKFSISEIEVKKLLARRFKQAEISHWQSGTGRRDLHCIASKECTGLGERRDA